MSKPKYSTKSSTRERRRSTVVIEKIQLENFQLEDRLNKLNGEYDQLLAHTQSIEKENRKLKLLEPLIKLLGNSDKGSIQEIEVLESLYVELADIREQIVKEKELTTEMEDRYNKLNETREQLGVKLFEKRNYARQGIEERKYGRMKTVMEIGRPGRVEGYGARYAAKKRNMS